MNNFKITSNDPEVQRMLDNMTIGNMTLPLITNYFRMKMERATDSHLSTILDECYDPKKHGTEVSDLIVNDMMRHTHISELEVKATLQYAAIDEAAKRWRKSIE